MTYRDRAHPLWYAFVLHRLSGVCLALFLPAHFWLLSRAVADPQAFRTMIAWTDQPAVKIAEWGLVALLAIHFFGGIRLLVMELTPWQPWQKGWAAAAAALGFAVSCLFLLSAI